MPDTTILIVDDHPLMREALRAAVEDEEDIELLGEAQDGREALAFLRDRRPDVILLDLMMPGMDGLTAIPLIFESYPEARILVLTSAQDDVRITSAIEAGVLGFVTKDVQRAELLQAIRTVRAGQSYLTQAVARRLMASVRERGRQRGEAQVMDALTRREREVFRLLGEGASNHEIAQRLASRRAGPARRPLPGPAQPGGAGRRSAGHLPRAGRGHRPGAAVACHGRSGRQQV
jgi:DNA-binding NarL/FixJ family response regulator